MIKLIGAAVILISSALSSVRAVKRLGDRVRSMQSICASLEIMKSEIGSRLTPIPEIFELLAEQADQPARALYKNASKQMDRLGELSLSAIWKNAVESTPELRLTDTEKLTLCEVGMCLGRYDPQDQQIMLDRAAGRFESYRKRAEEDRQRNFKTQAYLGVISGVFIVIVLL